MPSVFPANIKAESVKQILDALLFFIWNLKCSSIFLQRCGISRLPCLHLLNHPQRNMAIPVRVSIQILLVIFLCRIEAVQRLAFHDNGLVKPGLQLLHRTPGNGQIRIIHGINARPILRAHVKPLFVERSRINDVVKQLQQCFQRKLLTLPGDIGPLFRPQGAGADILTKYVLRSVKDDLGEERCR